MSIVPTRRALVVDDSHAARLAAARLIEPYGFDVDLAEDGAVALRRMEDLGVYDLVLVDIRMPTLDGHELLRMMRARANFTPVVVMTASTDMRSLVATLKLGSTDLLVKPLQPQLVKEALARALNLSPTVLEAETPRVLVVGPEPLAASLRGALPSHVEVDRVEREALGTAVQQRPYRLVAFSLCDVLSSKAGEAEVSAAAAASRSVLEAQPGAALCAVTLAGEQVGGFDASVTLEGLGELVETSLYPNAVRPLVMHDESLVVVTGFRGATGTEATYFAVGGRRLQLAVTLHAAASARQLTIDLTRVPAQSAAVERLARGAVAAAAGRVADLRLLLTPAMHPTIDRLGLPARAEVPTRLEWLGPVIRWTADLGIGVESIDGQHQELFSQIDALAVAMRAGRGAKVIREALGFLEKYTEQHFADEEALMAEALYPGLQEHRAQHQALRARLLSLVELHRREGPDADVRRGLEQGVVSLYQHVRRLDRAMGEFLARRR